MDRSASRELTLLMATMDPPSAADMLPAKARMTSHAPLAFTAITRSQSSGLASSSKPPWPMPAHTVTVAGTPMRSIVAATARVTWSGSATSHRMSKGSAMSHTTTSAPPSRRRSTTAAPIPDAPPTTTAGPFIVMRSPFGDADGCRKVRRRRTL